MVLVYLLLIAVLVVLSLFHFLFGGSKTTSPRAAADQAERTEFKLKWVYYLMLFGIFVFLILIFATDY